MEFGLDFIKKLKPVKFKFKAPLNDGRDHFGFIAQDVNEVVPKEDYGFVIIKNGYYQIDYYEFISPIVKAIQELDHKIDTHNLNAQIVQELNDLTERVKKIEAKLKKSK